MSSGWIQCYFTRCFKLFPGRIGLYGAELESFELPLCIAKKADELILQLSVLCKFWENFLFSKL